MLYQRQELARAMSSFNFLDIQQGEKKLRFQMLRSVARQNYVTARIAFVQFLTEPACLLAQQSIEMILKAIIALNYQEKWGHNLKAIVESHAQYISCAKQILENPKMIYFIENLVKAYELARYGEAKYNIETGEAAGTLDELFFMLDKTWAETIKGEQGPLYVPEELEKLFLKGNQFFTADKITSNPLGIIGFPVKDLPELPRSEP
jgi:HEPN domain-containing protein